MPVVVALAVGRGAVGGRTLFPQFPICKSRPPDPGLPPSMYDSAFPICAANTSVGVCPIAIAKPVSLIIGAMTSALSISDSGRSIALDIAEAQATTPSCHVDLNPLPVNLPPSGVSNPFVNSSFKCSSTILVLIIHLCQIILWSRVTE